MPQRARKPCPTCGRTRGCTCRRSRPRPCNTETRKAANRFYASRAWKRIRAVVLLDNPICVACQREPATEVDHVLDRALRPDLELEGDNLQALCKRCHSRKTGSTRSHSGRR